MLNATSIRSLLGVLVLVCAPAMAIIPADIDIKLGGAQQVSIFGYQVKGGDKISLAFTTKPGALLFAFAMPLDDQDSVLLPLLYEKASASGQAYTELTVPKGVAGVFQIEAVALSAEGEELHSAILWVEIVAESQRGAHE